MDKDVINEITLEEFREREGLVHLGNTGLEWMEGWTTRKYRGVRLQKSGRWGAAVRDPYKGARVWLGTYDTAEEAARAYDEASLKFLGYKAIFNFPENVPGVELHNNLEVESEKLEESHRRFIDTDVTYSTSPVNPEKGSIAPDLGEDSINAMKGLVEGDGINISFHDLKKHFGKPLNLAAENIGVSRSTIKRICRKHGIFRWPSNKRNKHTHFCRSHQANIGPIRTPRKSPYRNNFTSPHEIREAEATVEDCRMVTIKALYEDTMMKFQLNIASKLSLLEEEIAKWLKLNVGGFTMVYQDDEDDSVSILCDSDLQFCFKSLALPGKDVKIQK